MRLKPADAAPIARISLFLLTGYLAAKGGDPALISFLRTDPEVAALVTGMIATVWYGFAKFFGWSR